ncbi:hypothetical protein EYF80_002175 [Liparis tanakae]|uniref:Uncharacterized protein n=1 Tax=Liparis tanakae TaxID=230148 RepID=A0A4Z2JCV9_9TELE|nr:hypothetical protein EYF80_002175 [Liparis tanakae]
MVAICVRRANLSLMVQVVTVVRYATRDRSSLSNCSPPSYDGTKCHLGVFSALDAHRVELPLLQAAMHEADRTADATLDVLKRRSREALPQLIIQHLPNRCTPMGQEEATSMRREEV